MWNTSNKYKELIYTGKECLLNIYIEDGVDIYTRDKII